MQQDILFGILLTMLENKKVSARELSHKFSLSRRSVYRYIDTLCAAGVPVISAAGQQGGFFLSENFVLNSTYLTEEEFRRILAALQALPGVTDDIQNKILISKIKVMSKSDEKDFVLHSDQLFVSTVGFNTLRNKMSVIQKALYERTVLRIRYHSRTGEITLRDIEPHALILENGVWYVYAFCRLRETFRLFKVARVATLTSLDKSFKRKPITPPEHGDSKLNEKSKIINIGMLVEEKSKPDVEEWIGIENVRVSGTKYYGACSMPLDNELVSKILSFGDGVEVTAPQELRNAVKAALLSTLKIYNP